MGSLDRCAPSKADRALREATGHENRNVSGRKNLKHATRDVMGAKHLYGKTLSILLASLVVVPLVCGQNTSKLEVEVSRAGQVKILACEVSYGQVLRALRGKLDVEIEIPPLADNLKLSYARIDSARPEEAFEKLLEGSGLGYGLLRGASGPRIRKVVVVGSTPQNAAGKAILVPAPNPLIAQAPEMQMRPFNEEDILNDAESVGAPEEATVGLEKLFAESSPVSGGTSPIAVVLPLSEAEKLLGVPAGVPPEEVGITKTLALPPDGLKLP
jgi:hypothetical protein